MAFIKNTVVKFNISKGEYTSKFSMSLWGEEILSFSKFDTKFF